MAGNYSRFGSIAADRFRSIFSGDTPQEAPLDVPQGIMAKSRFSGRDEPIAIQPLSRDTSATSFYEEFAKMMAMSSTDPDAVADAVLPSQGAQEPDLSDWDNMPPPPGRREDETVRALGTVPNQTRVNERGTEVMNIDVVLDKIMENEGGFQQWEDDRGNYVNNRLIGTNRGITPHALAEYRGVNPSTITVNDIKNVSDAEARDIFLQKYYFANGLDRLPSHLQANVLDMYINSGTNAISILQDLLGVERDGVLGAETLEALENSNITNKRYAERRMQFYNAIVRNNPSQRGFLQGWLNRANRYMED